MKTLMMVFYKTIFEIDVVKKPMAFLKLSPTYLRWFLKTLVDSIHKSRF